VDFLSKPFNDEELLQAVAQALNKSRREQREQSEQKRSQIFKEGFRF